MFTHIRLKNYKSLVDFHVDFLQKKKTAKKAVFIYGENGVGKSNFTSAFFTLFESMQTLSVRNVLQKLMDEQDEVMKKEFILKAIKRRLRDTVTIIEECKTIGSQESMILEFGFIVDGKEGNYFLEYDNNQIVKEKLEFVLNRNKTVFFDISYESSYINQNIFFDKEFYAEMRSLVEKYKGKHTLLSIIVNEKEEKAQEYIEKCIHPRLLDVIYEIMKMSIKVKIGNRGEHGKAGLSHPILGELESGYIDISEGKELEKAEELLNDFFTKTYGDIKEVYYNREIEDGKIHYELMFKKLIHNRIVDVSYELESTGTQHLLSVLPYILMCVEGTVVVIDEIDTGIHDLLVDSILKNVLTSIKGQLILTTHNTMLLESEVDPQYIYTFIEDENANKKMVPITDFEDRAHPNLNYRDRYLKGMYGGVPLLGDIDFDELREVLD